MRTYTTLAGLARHLDQVRERIPDAVDAELGEAGQAMQADARGLMGRYQAGWPGLAESTKAERERLGYPPDDPLLREGLLRGAITFQLEDGRRGDRTVFVGVPEGVTLSHPYRRKPTDAHKIMAVHEYGSTDGRVPARPVFGIIVNRIDARADAFGAGVLRRIGLEHQAGL